MFSTKIFVVLLVVFMFERVITSGDLQSFKDKLCVGRGHTVYYLDNCCKNQSVTAGIGTSAQWMKCAVPPTDDDEAYVDTMWRIYMCMLKMVVPKDQETISLEEFGNAMTADYPETLKTEINERLKNSTSYGTRNEADSSASVDFKNIEMIDRLRVNYFDIEKQVCGGELNEDFRDTTGIGCNFLEELLHRGGGCCDNNSIPIHDNKYIFLNPKNCSNTLSKFKEKLETINSTRVNEFLFECEASCQLIQNGVISVEDLISFKVADDIPIEKIVKEFTPKYYSKMIQKRILDHVKTNFSSENPVVDKYSFYHLDVAINISLRLLPEEMHGCAVHDELHSFVFRQFDMECI